MANKFYNISLFLALVGIIFFSIANTSAALCIGTPILNCTSSNGTPCGLAPMPCQYESESSCNSLPGCTWNSQVESTNLTCTSFGYNELEQTSATINTCPANSTETYDLSVCNNMTYSCQNNNSIAMYNITSGPDCQGQVMSGTGAVASGQAQSVCQSVNQVNQTTNQNPSSPPLPNQNAVNAICGQSPYTCLSGTVGYNESVVNMIYWVCLGIDGGNPAKCSYKGSINTSNNMPSYNNNYQCSNGQCSLNSTCVPIGYRTSNSYCNINGNITQFNSVGASCNNDFECSSYFCVSNQCVSPNLIQSVLLWFERLFGKN